MEKIKYCFVVLTYNGFNDFKKLYRSLSNIQEKFAVVLVDSFSSELNRTIGESIAGQLNIDFISVPNRGYGAGNNVGIKFAIDNYNFEYLIIANPDTIIDKIDYNIISNYGENVIIGPQITNFNGKNKNPLYFKKYKLPFSILRHYVRNGSLSLLYIYLALNKIYSIFFRLKYRRRNPIGVYALHGSFMIIGQKALSKLIPLFDERMFLYAEENHVAERAKSLNIPLLLDKNLQVRHKENGSTNTEDVNKDQKHTLQSLRVFFENIY